MNFMHDDSCMTLHDCSFFQAGGRGPKLNWSKQTPHPIGSANVLSALGPSNVQCSPRIGQISAATVETFGLAKVRGITDGKCCKDMMPILQIHHPYLNQSLYTVYMYIYIYMYICTIYIYIPCNSIAWKKLGCGSTPG